MEECIRWDILADYLKKKGSEVINMLIAEYDYDLDIEVPREEAFEKELEESLKNIQRLMEELASAQKPENYGL